jgi:hypothetical protein
MSTGTKPLPTIAKSTKAAIVSHSPAEENLPEPPKQTGKPIMVDLGIYAMVDLDGGYIPSRPELDLTEKSRRAIKRLTLTLDQQEAKLSDGTIVGTSVAKSIVWLCERFADAI